MNNYFGTNEIPLENISAELIPIRYHAKTLGEELAERKASPEISIKSLPSLNLKMHGMHRRRLYVVGARSGMAKTAFVLQIATDVALQGKRVLFVSLESTKSELLERIFCNWFEIDNFDLLRGGFGNYESQWEEFQKRLESLPLIVCEGIGKSIQEIRKLFETLEPAPDVVVVDYVQMVSVMGREAITTISEFVKSFRKFCIEKNVAGILVSQLNRDADSVVPTMAQLKGAGTLEENADAVWLLHKTTDNEGNIKKYYFIIAKNRFGRADFKVNIKYIGKYYKFIDGEEDSPEIKRGTPVLNKMFGEEE